MWLTVGLQYHDSDVARPSDWSFVTKMKLTVCCFLSRSVYVGICHAGVEPWLRYSQVSFRHDRATTLGSRSWNVSLERLRRDFAWSRVKSAEELGTFTEDRVLHRLETTFVCGGSASHVVIPRQLMGDSKTSTYNRSVPSSRRHCPRVCLRICQASRHHFDTQVLLCWSV